MVGGETAGTGVDIAALESCHFTRRQADVIRLVASGLSDKQIARELRISHRTVRTHLERVFEANRLHSRTVAALVWLRVTSRDPQ